MKAIRCPKCNEPTFLLWVSDTSPSSVICHACSNEQPSGARICLFPALRSDGTWEDGPDVDFPTLREFVIDRLDGTFPLAVLEGLVKKMAAFATPNLARGIKV